MPVKVLIICIIVCISAFIGALTSPVFSGGDHADIAKYYEGCIVREIEKCESKLVLLATSKSKNLKDYVAVKALKAKFLNAEKEVLIEEMVEMQLEPKQYKVELYLHSRFHGRDQ